MQRQNKNFLLSQEYIDFLNQEGYFSDPIHPDEIKYFENVDNLCDEIEDIFVGGSLLGRALKMLEIALSLDNRYKRSLDLQSVLSELNKHRIVVQDDNISQDIEQKNLDVKHQNTPDSQLVLVVEKDNQPSKTLSAQDNTKKPSFAQFPFWNDCAAQEVPDYLCLYDPDVSPVVIP